MKLAWVIAGVFGAAAAESPAVGAIVYLTQQRSIAANGFANGQPEGGGPIAAPGFGDFDMTRLHTFSNGSGTAYASQNSRLLPGAILVDEFARAMVTGSGIEISPYSRFEVTFRVDEPSAFMISHSHLTSGNRPAFETMARLSGPNGQVFEWRENASTIPTWPESPVGGTLVAGTYSLRVESFVNVGSPSGAFGTIQASASLAFVIPAPSTGWPGALLGCSMGFWGRRRRARQTAG